MEYCATVKANLFALVALNATFRGARWLKAVSLSGLIFFVLASSIRGDEKPLRVAGIATAYYHNSHADLILGRLVQGHNLDGTGAFPKLKLASLYTDQVETNNQNYLDKSREVSKQFGFPIYGTVTEALTLGTGKLAVDGVLVVAEHGNYPSSETGATLFPKKRFMAEVFQVFEASGRSVPVFCDKHLADNWEDAKWIYDNCQRLKVPLMAGSSLPGLWRYPPTDVTRGAKLKEMVAVSYHRLDIYGFHALEMTQCLAERRAGGETGIKAVQYSEGPSVWEAGHNGGYDRRLLDECVTRFKERPLRPGQTLEGLAKMPSRVAIEYRDGFKVNVLTLNGAAAEWSVAWRYEDGRSDSTLFWTQEARPLAHFTPLVQGIEQMIRTGKPTWPAERTLLTTGVLDALLVSRKNGGQRINTPYLHFSYESSWDWRQPPLPPPDRKLTGP